MGGYTIPSLTFLSGHVYLCMHALVYLLKSNTSDHTSQTEVIEKMMTHDPDLRPTANHIIDSRWFGDLKKSVQEKPGRVPPM